MVFVRIVEPILVPVNDDQGALSCGRKRMSAFDRAWFPLRFLSDRPGSNWNTVDPKGSEFSDFLLKIFGCVSQMASLIPFYH